MLKSLSNFLFIISFFSLTFIHGQELKSNYTPFGKFENVLTYRTENPSGISPSLNNNFSSLPNDSPVTAWSRSIDGGGWESGYYAQQTSDGGYIMAGRTDGLGAGNFDFWLVKTDQNGDTLWTRTFGNTYIDEAYTVKQTADGGYIICGSSTAFGMSFEGWLLRTDSNGNQIWSKGYHQPQSSTAGIDLFYDVYETSDGGFIAIGFGWGIGDMWDSWIVKVNSQGNIIWNKMYGDYYWERLYKIIPTIDGNFVAVGDKHVEHGPSIVHDGWLVKFNGNGDTLWTKTFNRIDYIDLFRSVQQTPDGDYIIVGETAVDPNIPGYFGWVVKTDNTGNLIWSQTYNDGGLLDVQVSQDNNFIACGTVSTSSTTQRGNDGWLLKFDGNGDIIWEEIYSPTELGDLFLSIQKTFDNGYILAGSINSAITGTATGVGELWLVKLEPEEITTTLTSFNESFDGVVSPALPDGWTGHLEVLLSNTVAEVKTLPHGTAPSQPNAVFIMNGLDGSNGQLDSNAFVALVSPLVEVGASGATFKFWGNGSNPVFVGSMSDPEDASTFSTIEQINLTSDWTEYTIPITIQTNTHIAIKHGNVNNVTPLFVDQLSFEQNETILTSFTENFDGVTQPALPGGWISCLDVLLSNTVAEVKTAIHGTAPTQPNAVFIMNGLDGSNGQIDPNAFVALVSPLVEVGANGGLFKFWGNGVNPVIVGTMSDPEDASTFTMIQQINITSDWIEYSVNINDPGNTYIAIKHGNVTNVTPVFVDQLSFDQTVPVELSSFTANVKSNSVLLNWSTVTEANNRGFEVQRKENDGVFEAIGFIAGKGTSTEVFNYSYTDQNLVSGTYAYRLKQIDFDGTFKIYNTVEVIITAPYVYSLNQNYPNPFNPTTAITFSLPVDAKVTVRVFNILGEVISIISDNEFSAGSHTINFTAETLVSGVYLYSLEAKGKDNISFNAVKKMMVVK